MTSRETSLCLAKLFSTACWRRSCSSSSIHLALENMTKYPHTLEKESKYSYIGTLSMIQISTPGSSLYTTLYNWWLHLQESKMSESRHLSFFIRNFQRFSFALGSSFGFHNPLIPINSLTDEACSSQILYLSEWTKITVNTETAMPSSGLEQKPRAHELLKNAYPVAGAGFLTRGQTQGRLWLFLDQMNIHNQTSNGLLETSVFVGIVGGYEIFCSNENLN